MKTITIFSFLISFLIYPISFNIASNSMMNLSESLDGAVSLNDNSIKDDVTLNIPLAKNYILPLLFLNNTENLNSSARKANIVNNNEQLTIGDSQSGLSSGKGDKSTLIYCNSYPPTPNGHNIFNVTVGTLNNSSDCNTLAPGPGSLLRQYSNYTTTVSAPNMIQNSYVNFSISFGYCSTYLHGGTYVIYIDFNQDGDFEDSGERVVMASYSTPPSSVSGNIYVPIGAVLGITRMRVSMWEGAAQIFVAPCGFGPYSTGEVEDYNVNISIGPPAVTTTAPSGINPTTATSGGNITNQGADVITARGVCWSLSANPTTADAHTTDGTGAGVFVSSITGLTEGSIYHVRSYATNSNSTSYGDDLTFTTTCGVNIAPFTESFEYAVFPPTDCWSLFSAGTFIKGINLPGRETDNENKNVSKITTGKITPNDSIVEYSPLTEYCPSGAGNPALYTDIFNVTFGTLNNSSDCSTLAPGPGSIQNGYSNYTTTVAAPTIITGVSTPFSVQIGNCTPYGSSYTFIYIDFNKNFSFNDAGERVYASPDYVSGAHTETGNITIPVGTPVGTTRMRVINGESSVVNPCYYGYYSYGETEDYNITIAAGPPTVSTTVPSGINPTSASSGGNVTAQGLGGSVTQRGVCWSTSANPTIANARTINGSGTGSFSSSITGLIPNTLYHVRAYATNSYGTDYGSDLTFTTIDQWNRSASASGFGTGSGSAYVNFYNVYSGVTMDLVSPTIDIIALVNPILKFDYAYATRSGENDQLEILYSTNNGSSFTSLTIYNGGTSGPLNTGGTTASNFVPTSGQWGTKVLDLPAGTNKIKFHAISARGNNLYVDNINFVPRLPVVSTTEISGIGRTTVSTGGNVTISGGAGVTARGVCWSTSLNPTVLDSHTTNGTGTGIFTSSLTGLSEGTTYHVRAYATNSIGTSYGSDLVFTTLCTSDVPPIILDFEGSVFPPLNCWTSTSPSYPPIFFWKRDTVASGYGTGNASMFANFYDYYEGTADFTSNTIDLSGLSYPFLKFDHAYATFADRNDSLQIFYSSNDGASFDSLVHLAGGNGPLNTAGYTDIRFVPTASQWATKSYQLPLGTNRIRFRAISKHGNNLYIDNINIFDAVPMNYISSTTVQADTIPLGRGTTNQKIIGMQVVTTGYASPLSATSFALNTNGTNAPSTDITNAKVYYTGNNSAFGTSNQFGSTVASPNGTFNITGTQTLLSGTNYFWLTYDVPSGAVAGNSVDAECTQITIGSDRTPTVTAPPGVRHVAERMAGIYTVGLSAFNKATGKNLYEQTVTRKVNTDESGKISSKNDNIISGIERDSKSDKLNNSDGKQINERTENRQIITSRNDNNILTQTQNHQTTGFETVKVLYENGKPYDGTLFVYKDKKNTTFQTDGPNAGIYATLTAAINDLNSIGVNAPVTFTLLDASYPSETFPIVINSVTGASAVNTVTIKPGFGVTSVISGSSPSAIFKLNGADYVTIDGSSNSTSSRDLTIENTNTAAYTTPVWIASLGTNAGSTHDTIRNCNLYAGSKSSKTYGLFMGGAGIDTSGADNDSIAIINNSVNKAYYGIYSSGTDYDVSDALVIKGNDIGGMGNVNNRVAYCGIFVGNCYRGRVTQNHVRNVFQSSAGTSKYNYGIYVYGNISSTTVDKNIVDSVNYAAGDGGSGRGIYIHSPSAPMFGVSVINNVIFNILGDGNSGWYNGGGLAGIIADGEVNVIGIYYNSINLSGNLTYGASCTSADIAFLSYFSYGNELINNVLVNSITHQTQPTSKAWNVYTELDFDSMNYNNYYVNSGAQGYIGYINGANSTDLAAWRTATGKDLNSVSGDPGFTSAANLLPDITNPNCWKVNGLGSQIAGITTDINGNTRSTTVAGGSTDLGAYQITPSSVPLSAIETGTLVAGSFTTYSVGGRTIARIDWGPGGTVPTSVEFRYYPGTNPPGSGSFNVGNAYWSITATGGSGYTYDITFYYEEAQLGAIGALGNEANLRLAKSGDGGTSYTPYTTGGTGAGQYVLNTTTNTIKIYGLTSFSIFAQVDSDSPLPVTLTSFTSNVTGRNVKLKWATDSELNNNGFNIERKITSGNWGNIGFVRGKGTINITSNYMYEDKNLNAGKYNYRLKQIDANGNFEYHYLNSVLEVGLPVKFDIGQNYPNPFNPLTKIDYQLPADSKVTLLVYDMTGREVKTLLNNEQRSAGYYTAEFNGSSFASGTYFYRFIAESGGKQNVMTKKMILIK